jgi:hypothetical protein
MKKLAAAEVTDVGAPVNRLVQALQTTAEKATASTEGMEALSGRLRGVTAASQELGKQLGAEVGGPLIRHGEAMQRVQEQLGLAAGEMARVAQRLEAAVPRERGREAYEGELLTKLAELQKEMSGTNAQIKALIGRIDANAGTDHKLGLFGRIFGGGGGAGSDNR